MTTVALVGATGLTGSHILSTLLTQPAISSITTYTRRPVKSNPSPKLTVVEEKDSKQWAPALQASKPSLFISALATTRGDAGGFEQQRAIDHDLNVELAKAAHAAGSKVYVLISADSSNPDSRIAYVKMKGETEAEIEKLGFEHCVFIKPGLIVGQREKGRAMEQVPMAIARAVGSLSHGLKDFWAQDADVIAKAAVRAALDCLEGKAPAGGVWKIRQADIVRLGRTEWSDAS